MSVIKIGSFLLAVWFMREETFISHKSGASNIFVD